MYKINMNNKTAEKIEETTFAQMGLRERNDIQEWIANTPEVLEYSSELLIIQKEFDGFSDTDRRLDLLALDKQGNLVIIENKRDDTGKDVVWQAINYASFCSTLTSREVVQIYQAYLNSNQKNEDAEQNIKDFFDDDSVIYPTNTQKIILVSREFRKEVLSAAQWLNSNGIDITCIKFTPHLFEGEILLEVDRILPQEEMKDYTIKLSRKTADVKNQEIMQTKGIERNIRFWRLFATRFNRQHTVFENINSWDNNKSSWIGASAGIGHGLYFNFVIADQKYRAELYIDNQRNPQYNKAVFDRLYANRNYIEEQAHPYTVTWERLDDKRASRIFIGGNQYPLTETDNWEQVIDFLIQAMERLIDLIKEQEVSIRALG